MEQKVAEVAGKKRNIKFPQLYVPATIHAFKVLPAKSWPFYIKMTSVFPHSTVLVLSSAEKKHQKCICPVRNCHVPSVMVTCKVPYRPL